MNKMYAMVLFLLIVTTTMSSVWCSSTANNDEKILMVVEEETSSMQQQGMDQDPVQLGRFGLKGARSVTLSWLVNGRENCVPPESNPCGLLDRCCEGLGCTNPIKGICKPYTDCSPKGTWCNGIKECCYPYRCKIISAYNDHNHCE